MSLTVRRNLAGAIPSLDRMFTVLNRISHNGTSVRITSPGSRFQLMMWTVSTRAGLTSAGRLIRMSAVRASTISTSGGRAPKRALTASMAWAASASPPASFSMWRNTKYAGSRQRNDRHRDERDPCERCLHPCAHGASGVS